MNATMRAVVCESWRPFDELELTRVSVPPLRHPEDVRIEVRHAGVSWATTLVVAGKYQRKPPLPFSPGTEVTGIVLEVGPQVSGLVPGDRVCAVADFGAYAEQAVIHRRHVFKVPDGLPLDAAIALPISYMTAYGALLWRAKIKAGDRVLIHGAAGAVGLGAVDIAQAHGCEVFAVVRGEEKRRFLARRGVDHVIDSTTADFQAVAREATGGRGVDVILDTVGGSVFERSLRCLDEDGRLLVVGFVGGDIATVATNLILLKNIAVAGFNLGQYVGWGVVDERARFAARYGQGMEQLLAWWCEGRIAPVLHARRPLAEFRDAMRLVTDRQAVGRVLLDL